MSIPLIRQKVVLIRHGETEWSRNGRHTSVTDLPLTENGREHARALQPVLAKWRFDQVFTSPLRRARETCTLSGLGDAAQIDPDLSEWHYGRYEGLTTDEIHRQVPDWDVFTHPCPDGETAQQVGARVDRAIARVRQADGDVAVFSHGHLLRVFAARWTGLAPSDGHMFVLDTATLNVLGAYHDSPAIVTWNAPL